MDLIIFDSLGVSENGVYTPCKRPLEWGNDVQPDTLGFNWNRILQETECGFHQQLGYVTSGTKNAHPLDSQWICRPQQFPIVFFKCCDHFNPFPSKTTSLVSFNLQPHFFLRNSNHFHFVIHQFDPQGRELEGPSICSHAGPVPVP